VMGFSALGRTDMAVAAYHAYRRGFRTDLAVGASMLVRRSNDDVDWESGVGLPDAAYGALGLAELIEPGVLDRVLRTGYAEAFCRGDVDGDADVDAEDAYAWVDVPIDTDGDRRADPGDLQALIDVAREDERRVDR